MAVEKFRELDVLVNNADHQRLPWPESDERRRVLQRLEAAWEHLDAAEPKAWRTKALTTAILRVVEGLRARGMSLPRSR